MTAGRTVAAMVVSAAAAAAVGRLPAPALTGWQRVNYRGRSVSLSGGLAAAVGASAGAAVSGPIRRPALIAAAAAALAGGYDDLFAPRAEQRSDKGLTGHLAALRAGRVSGGVVKVALIGAGSLLAAVQLPASDDADRRRGRQLISRLERAALIAGSANLLNLFDLRPGRAGKIALTLGVGALAGPGGAGPMAAVAAATAVTLPGDLAEHTMLGDLGANTLGALIGVRLASGTRTTRVIAAAAIGALTIASERVSFTQVIAATPALRWLDELGRDGTAAIHPAPIDSGAADPVTPVAP